MNRPTENVLLLMVGLAVAIVATAGTKPPAIPQLAVTQVQPADQSADPYGYPS